MVYEKCKIGNIYKCKDGRLRIHIVYPNGKTVVMSYPKFLMEKYRNRYLTEEETVDHIDCNPLNNAISNLRILSRNEHAFIDVKTLKSQIFICPVCGEEFELSGKKLSASIYNRKQGRAGPFCSKHCVGVYGASIQNNKMVYLPINLYSPIYTTKKQQELQKI